MNKIAKILIPFNFKESAVNALDYALSFSEDSQDNSITLLYVMQEKHPMTEDEIERRLAQFVKEYQSKYSQIAISYQIAFGDLVSETLAFKDKLKADLILMGTKGSAGNAQLEDSNTSRLIRQAQCPVIVVPKSCKEFKLDHIALAIDKGDIESPDLLSILLVVARRFDAKIHVLTVYNEDDEDFLKERDNESVLEYYFERYYATSSATRSSNIADSILDYQKKQAIDMLAIIPQNHSKSRPPSEGKLTQYLALNADIPILIID
jgi:nucleotide-binding universal stress UspA family protein